MGEWQPIETAPKDGTDVLLFWPDAPTYNPAMMIGWWNRGWYPEWRADDMDPTHWMTLPAPPEAP